MDEWGESLKKLQSTPPERMREGLIHVLRHPNESEVLKKMKEGHKLTEDELEMLTEGHRKYYAFIHRDLKTAEKKAIAKHKHAKEMEKRRRKQQLEDSLIDRIERKIAFHQPLSEEERAFNEVRKKRAEKALHDGQKRIKDKEHYELIMKKLQNWQALSPGEKEFADNYGRMRNKTRGGGNVDIDSSLILTDVVNGDYTLQDVNLVREGAAALNRDAIESSPIQLLEKVLESMKRSTQEALQTSDTDHFFNSIDSDLLKRITPLQINEIVSSCKTGIEMLHSNSLDENESKSALESFIKALVMSEGENKIKEALQAAEKKFKVEQRRAQENMAEIAALSGAFSEDASKLSGEKKEIDLGFNITTEYDISFTPSDDPELYKPLEIISYLGMTNCPTI